MFHRSELLQEMLLCVYNMIFGGRRGRKPGYIHEMGSHDLKSFEVKCQRNKSDRFPLLRGWRMRCKRDLNGIVLLTCGGRI